MIDIFDLKVLLGHFRDVGENRWGVVLDMEKLEAIFAPIREGKEKLSTKHLEGIKEDYAYPAWWRMPQVSNSELEGLSTAFIKMMPRDERLIWQLFDILKNIEIVSCILRFVDPEKYAIFSPPVDNLLNIRGKDQVKKYVNYLSDLEQIGNAYNIVRIADVDHALWTLANIINSDQLRNKPPYDQFYLEYQRRPNIIKTIASKNSLKQIWSENALYLDLAQLFLEDDPIIAGLIASREFEHVIKWLCKEHGVKLRFKTVNGISWIYIPELAENLRMKKGINPEEEDKAKKYWELRNLLVHGSDVADDKLQEVDEMIEWLAEMSNKYRIEKRNTLKHEKSLGDIGESNEK